MCTAANYLTKCHYFGRNFDYEISYDERVTITPRDYSLKFREIDDIKTHSFIAKEVRLLSYVKDRSIVNIDKAEMDFSLYKKDIYERQIRIPKLQGLYEKKLTRLRAFQGGKDIWKSNRY